MSIFVIAEIGINHNGDMSIAKDLIKVASEAGCDAVKFQKRTVDLVYPKDVLDAPRDSPWGKTTREQKEGLEFGQDEYEQIDTFCRELNIDWFASAWDVESQKFLRQFSLKHNKIASAMIVEEDHLCLVAGEGKHTFVSTGMSTLHEIDRAVEIFDQSKSSFELMHCVSTYPMEDTDANLNCIPMLRERYNCAIGYSGHEVGLAVSYAAAALSITSLERHITLAHSMYGSDQAASIEPVALKNLVGAVRKIDKAMGDGQKRMLDSEVPIAKKLRVHLKWEASE